MALMPPRRSARLSEDNFGNHDQPLSSSPNVFQDRTRAGTQWQNSTTAVKKIGNGGKDKNTSSTGSIGSSSTAATGIESSKTTVAGEQKPRKERRWEEIAEESENEEEDGDFMIGFTRPIITGNAKHAASIPVPRQPRTTFHEQAGDDGFIFSTNANPTAANAKGKGKAISIEGARGAPPRRSGSGNDGKVDEALRITSNRSDRRVSSGPVKAVRRVSLLRDGTAAVPHPNIADTDLYRHCSSDLDPRQRLQHLAIWTLERSYAKIMKTYSAPSSSRHTLDDTVRGTIDNLVKNTLLLDWPGRRKMETFAKQGKSSIDSLRPHPRNEANAKAEIQLQKQINLMESEMKAWKEAESEMEQLKTEIESLQDTLSSLNSVEKDDCSELFEYLSPQSSAAEDQKDQSTLESIRKSLSNAATWLPTSDPSHSSALSTAQANLIRLSEDLFVQKTGERVPSRPTKRRRTTSHRGDNEGESIRLEPTPVHLQGTDTDPRWDDVEFNADLLNSHAHSFAQLARLSDRYITAVSARGAQAIGELIGSEDRSSTISVRAREGEIDGSSSSLISREGQNTLQRILSGIRKLESGSSISDEEEKQNNNLQYLSENKSGPSAAGDVSDGDILRAFAGISRARR